MRSNCPLNFALELFGDRWTLLIIRDLLFYGDINYNQLLNAEEGISTSMLAARLGVLEREEFVIKIKDPAHKQKVLYRLTEKGRDLLPVVLALGQWSQKYGPGKVQENFERVLAARLWNGQG
jgi:DNA-binding HxlR family transcriptional regulator